MTIGTLPFRDNRQLVVKLRMACVLGKAVPQSGRYRMAAADRHALIGWKTCTTSQPKSRKRSYPALRLGGSTNGSRHPG